jgi:hypothetical protein
MQPVPVPVERLFTALQGDFPNLEYLLIIGWHPSDHLTVVDIPKTFRAPRLRYLVVMGLHISIGFPSFTTILGRKTAFSMRVRRA